MHRFHALILQKTHIRDVICMTTSSIRHATTWMSNPDAIIITWCRLEALKLFYLYFKSFSLVQCRVWLVAVSIDMLANFIPLVPTMFSYCFAQLMYDSARAVGQASILMHGLGRSGSVHLTLDFYLYDPHSLFTSIYIHGLHDSVICAFICIE